MISVEDRLREKDAIKKSQIDSDEIRRYNQSVVIINELIPRLVDKINVNPPDRHEWVCVDGKKIVCWKLEFRADDGGYYGYESKNCYITPDGKIISGDCCSNGGLNIVTLVQKSALPNGNICWGNASYLVGLQESILSFYNQNYNQPKVEVKQTEVKQDKPWWKSIFG